MIVRFSFIVLFFLAPACTTLDEKTKSEIHSQFYSVEKDPQWRSGIMASFVPPSQGIGVHFDSPSFFSTGVGKKKIPTSKTHTSHMGGYLDAFIYQTPDVKLNEKNNTFYNANHLVIDTGVMERTYINENISSYFKLGFSMLGLDRDISSTKNPHYGFHLAFGGEIWGEVLKFTMLDSFTWSRTREFIHQSGIFWEVGYRYHSNVRADELPGRPRLFSQMALTLGFISTR